MNTRAKKSLQFAPKIIRIGCLSVEIKIPKVHRWFVPFISTDSAKGVPTFASGLTYYLSCLRLEMVPRGIWSKIGPGSYTLHSTSQSRLNTSTPQHRATKREGEKQKKCCLCLASCGFLIANGVHVALQKKPIFVFDSCFFVVIFYFKIHDV